MKDENEKLYLEKKIFFNKKKAMNELIKELDRKNTFFYKYNREIIPVKIEISKKIIDSIEGNLTFYMKKHLKSSNNTFSYYVYHGLFDNGKSYNNLITTGYNKNPNSKFPLLFINTGVLIGGGIDYYISEELYIKRNKSIFKHLHQTKSIDVSPELLTKFRNHLNDPNFSVSKLRGFNSPFHINHYGISYNDFFMPEGNASIKIKSPKKVNDAFKNTLESKFNLLDNITYSPEKI